MMPLDTRAPFSTVPTKASLVWERFCEIGRGSLFAGGVIFRNQAPKRLDPCGADIICSICLVEAVVGRIAILVILGVPNRSVDVDRSMLCPKAPHGSAKMAVYCYDPQVQLMKRVSFLSEADQGTRPFSSRNSPSFPVDLRTP